MPVTADLRRPWWHGPSGTNDLLDPRLFEQRVNQAKAAREITWLFDPHDGQREILSSGARMKYVACGRRWGKSLLGIRTAVEWASETQGLVWLAGPTYQTAMRALWAKVIKYLPRKYRKVYRGSRRIELTSGGVLEVVSCDNPDNLRGEGLAGLVVDEAGYVTDYAWQEVLRPMLVDQQGSLLAISTPKGRKGWFYRGWQLGQADGAAARGYASWCRPSWTNPYLPASEIEELRETLPERVFQQEIEALFVDDVAQVFQNIHLIATAKRRQGPQPGRVYYMGIDWARTNDFTVVTVVDDLGRMVAMERWSRIADSEQLSRVRTLIELWQPVKVLAEKNSIGAVYIGLLREGGLDIEGFDTLGTTKPGLVQQLQAAIELRKAELLDDPVLLNELLSYERGDSPSGRPTYNAPSGFHDDTVVSLMLAWRAFEGDPEGDEEVVEEFRGDASSFMDSGTIAPSYYTKRRAA